LIRLSFYATKIREIYVKRLDILKFFRKLKLLFFSC